MVMSDKNVYKWSMIERASLAIMNFGGNIVLVRMLSAGDFGLLAMVAIFTAMAYNLSSCGLSDGLIHKLKPTPIDYSTVFVFNSSLGLVFGTSAILLAPAIARFFGHEEIVWIMRMYGICFFFQTMSFVQETRMRKQLEMKKLCIARLSANATALTLGIVLAALGCGYWALVSTQIFLSFFMFVYIVAISRWFPKVAFSVASFKEFFSFGIHLLFTFMINIFEHNVNTFVLGRFYTSAQTGIYYQGAKLANVPFSVTDTSINGPLFVVASNEEDEQRRRAKLLNMMGISVTINAAIALLLALISRPAIVFLYGERWIESAPIMTILVFYGFGMCFKYFGQTVFKTYGRTRFVRNLSACELVIQLCLLALFFRQGLSAIALTLLATVFVCDLIYVASASRLLHMSGRELYGGLLRPLLYPVLAFIVGGVAKLAIAPYNPVPFVECLVVAACFGSVMLIAHLRRRKTHSPH